MHGALALGGSLQVDEVDLGWIASLGLGFAPMPTDDPAARWSKTPFGEPVFSTTTAKFDVTAEQLHLGELLKIDNPKLTIQISPNRVDLDVVSGEVIGGSVAGRPVDPQCRRQRQCDRQGSAWSAGHSIPWSGSVPDGRSRTGPSISRRISKRRDERRPGLISSLTGGGTLAIHDGEVRYINPRAVNLVIKASDLGEQFTEEALAELFLSYIDAGSLKFREAEAAFSIAAGTIRIQNLGIETPDAKVAGSAAIDLNTLTSIPTGA